MSDTYNFGHSVQPLMRAHETRYAEAQERIDALQRDLAAAQARIERYEALLKRCSAACKVVPVLVRNGEHISLPMHIAKAIEKDGV